MNNSHSLLIPRQDVDLDLNSKSTMAGLMTRLLLVVVLSCLIPTAVSSEACEAGTTGVSATCGIVSAILGFLGALLCGATAGAACAPAFAGVAAVAGVCSTAVGVVPCGGDGKLFI